MHVFTRSVCVVSELSPLCQTDAQRKMTQEESWEENTKENSQKFTKQVTHQEESPLHPSGHTAMQHTTQAPNHMFTQISIQATSSSSQLLMRLWREQHRCPLWWHRLLTELKNPSFESDHCREAYCYMRGLALAKTEQQKGGEWNWSCNCSLTLAFKASESTGLIQLITYQMVSIISPFMLVTICQSV